MTEKGVKRKLAAMISMAQDKRWFGKDTGI